MEDTTQATLAPEVTESTTNETSSWIQSLEESFSELKKETTAFYEKGTAAAGGRARKILQDIRLLAKTGREHIQAARLERKAAK